MSSGEMAIRYGTTRASVCRHLRRLGITRPVSGVNSRNRKRDGEVIKNGYPVYHQPHHPRASAVGYVFKHILEIEKHLGYPPSKDTPIHHIDLSRTNYHISNLYICKDSAEHARIHRSLENIVEELLKEGVVIFENGNYKRKS